MITPLIWLLVVVLLQQQHSPVVGSSSARDCELNGSISLAKPAPWLDKSLYERLGGKKAIGTIVDHFVDIVGKDDRLSRCLWPVARDTQRLAKFRKSLVDQMCQASGGSCRYKGRGMKGTHNGLGITEDDFNAFMEDLVRALDESKVGEREKNELLGALGPMKSDIVEK